MSRSVATVAPLVLSILAIGTTAKAKLRAVDVSVEENLSGSAKESPSSISQDGLSLLLYSTRGTGSSSLWDSLVATRTTTNDPWGAPEKAPFSTINGFSGNTAHAIVSPNGLELFYAQEAIPNPPAPFVLTTDNVYRSTRSSLGDSWSAGAPQSDLQQIADFVRPMWISPDSKRLYFAAADAAPPASPLHPWDIFVAERASADSMFLASSANRIGSLSMDQYSELEVSLSSDETTAIFSARDRSGGAGNTDLWVAHRRDRDAEFGSAYLLEGANTRFNDRAPVLFGDTLYFMSDRSGNEQIYSAKIVPEPSSLLSIFLPLVSQAFRRRRSRHAQGV